MPAGTISNMISAIKRNESMRTSNRKTHRFTSKIKLSDYTYTPLTQEEKLRFAQENQKELKRKRRHKMAYAMLMVLFYSSIVSYALFVVFF